MTWRAVVAAIVDADTIDVTVVGTIRVRVADIQAPEMNTPEGVAAKAYMEDLLPVGSAVEVTPRSEDPHGRVVAHLHLNVGQRLVADGHARRWKDTP